MCNYNVCLHLINIKLNLFIAKALSGTKIAPPYYFN